MSWEMFLIALVAFIIYLRIRHPNLFLVPDDDYEPNSFQNNTISQDQSEHYELLQMYKGTHYWYGIGTYSSESSAEQAGIWAAERHPEHRYKVVRVNGDRKSTIWIS